MHCKLVFHVFFVAADPPYSLRWSTLKTTRQDESLHAKERRTEGWAQMAEMLYQRPYSSHECFQRFTRNNTRSFWQNIDGILSEQTSSGVIYAMAPFQFHVVSFTIVERVNAVLPPHVYEPAYESSATNACWSITVWDFFKGQKPLATSTTSKSMFEPALQSGRMTLMATSSPATSLGLASPFRSDQYSSS